MLAGFYCNAAYKFLWKKKKTSSAKTFSDFVFTQPFNEAPNQSDFPLLLLSQEKTAANKFEFI